MTIKITFAKPKPKKSIIVIAPVFREPKPKGFTFVFDPAQSNDPGPWWAVDRGSDGEPLPLREGEVAVVKLRFLDEDGWQFTLSNGKKFVRQKSVGIGFCDNLKDAAVYLLPDPNNIGGEKQYRNAVPKGMREAAFKAHHDYLQEKLKSEQKF